MKIASIKVAPQSFLTDSIQVYAPLKNYETFFKKLNFEFIGDFGISKVMTTRASGAHTVLGTPYYIREHS